MRWKAVTIKHKGKEIYRTEISKDVVAVMHNNGKVEFEKAQQHVPIKKGKVKYGDKPELNLIEKIESSYKQMYQGTLTLTTLEIGNFLKDKF